MFFIVDKPVQSKMNKNDAKLLTISMGKALYSFVCSKKNNDREINLQILIIPVVALLL